MMLTVIGTGIQLGQITIESLEYIKSSEKVFYVVADLITADWIRDTNPNAESLSYLYQEGRPRIRTYEMMVEKIMEQVELGKNVCAVFYGHPGVFAMPSHEAIRRAKKRGFDAKMIPAVSAEDCLFADIGIDPGSCGCTSFEATDFLARKRIFDQFSHLIIWQIGVIGELGYNPGRGVKNLDVLVSYLLEKYDEDHLVAIYEAPSIAIACPIIDWVKLSQLPKAEVSAISTLYVPPAGMAQFYSGALEQLGIATA